ncbi:hypothetical protein [Streptomyces sp. NPDC002328]|uniref:hypothetical protein n=1 Tax=Streptomyces sp. NPDC002328 TaxID=3364642 RepID=UPI0036876F51
MPFARPVRHAAVLPAGSLLLAGCLLLAGWGGSGSSSSPSSDGSPTAGQFAGFPVILDNCGQRVRVDSPPRRAGQGTII